MLSYKQVSKSDCNNLEHKLKALTLRFGGATPRRVDLNESLRLRVYKQLEDLGPKQWKNKKLEQFQTKLNHDWKNHVIGLCL